MLSANSSFKDKFGPNPVMLKMAVNPIWAQSWSGVSKDLTYYDKRRCNQQFNTRVSPLGDAPPRETLYGEETEHGGDDDDHDIDHDRNSVPLALLKQNWSFH